MGESPRKDCSGVPYIEKTDKLFLYIQKNTVFLSGQVQSFIELNLIILRSISRHIYSIAECLLGSEQEMVE